MRVILAVRGGGNEAERVFIKFSGIWDIGKRGPGASRSSIGCILSDFEKLIGS